MLGALLILVGAFMLLASSVAFGNGGNDFYALLDSGLITILCGAILWLYKFSKRSEINKREGYLIVALAWFSMGLFGALPYYLFDSANSVTDCLFESISGFTTTGATIFNDVESLPRGILFWRSLTQWIGGMGIIVLTVALLPMLGIGGIELVAAEAPGPTTDKIHPRIKETAKRLWYIYLGLTITLSLLLFFQDMSLFDAINHALTTISTGGFSTKNGSIGAFNSASIEYTTIFFMFISGCNFLVVYHLLKGKFKKAWNNEEFKYYIYAIIFFALLLGIWINIALGGSYTENFRAGLFSMVSLITTTGYVTSDYTTWTPGLTVLFFLFLFSGACAGSTSGGIKFIRHVVFVKNTYLEFKRILHPRAIIRLKINNELVAPRILTHILVFLLVYLILFVTGILTVTILGLDFTTALGGVATSLGNVGPAIGNLGPMNTFGFLDDGPKWVFMILMLLGRLELFTILIIFSPFFWRSN